MRLKLLRFIPLMALVAATVLMAATACGGNDAGESGAAQGAGAATPTTESGASPFPLDTESHY